MIKPSNDSDDAIVVPRAKIINANSDAVDV